MATEQGNARFKEKNDSQKRELQAINKIIKINEYLKPFNWAYVHPYLFGWEVELLKKMSEEGTGSTEAIFRIFTRAFYDLKTTASFIEGFFKKRKSLAPFTLLIDQAVVLALQKEYAGAINLLIPVIEGSMRHYLTVVQGQNSAALTKSSQLLKVFDCVAQDYVTMHREALEAEEADCHPLIRLDTNQFKQVIANEQAYITQWLSIAKEYLANNLYLDTRTGIVTDKLNRHAIVHGFTTDIYYSLENFLRLYHLLCFLSWAYGIADKTASPLVVAEEEVICRKWAALEKIRVLAAFADEAKLSIYATYPDFDKSAYLQTLPLSKVSQVIDSTPALFIEQRVRFIDQTLQPTTSPIAVSKAGRMMRFVVSKLIKLLCELWP
jgi:hypothetical protein